MMCKAKGLFFRRATQTKSATLLYPLCDHSIGLPVDDSINSIQHRIPALVAALD